MTVTPRETTVGEVMVRRPKTLPADATVADARTALENSSVKLLLLVDGGQFRGAVSEVPDGASPHEEAVAYADDDTPTATAELPVSAALERLEHKANGRLVVLDAERTLLGLVCLTTDGKSFCGTPSAVAVSED